MKRVPRIDLDTPIEPGLVAWCVWDDARVWLGEPLPRRWVRELIARANTVYARNAHFRRKIRGPGDSGRDYLWMFMRHWLAAILKAHRPKLHALMPVSYNSGHALPERPVRPDGIANQKLPRRQEIHGTQTARSVRRSPRRAIRCDELHARLFALV